MGEPAPDWQSGPPAVASTGVPGHGKVAPWTMPWTTAWPQVWRPDGTAVKDGRGCRVSPDRLRSMFPDLKTMLWLPVQGDSRSRYPCPAPAEQPGETSPEATAGPAGTGAGDGTNAPHVQSVPVRGLGEWRIHPAPTGSGWTTRPAPEEAVYPGPEREIAPEHPLCRRCRSAAIRSILRPELPSRNSSESFRETVVTTDNP